MDMSTKLFLILKLAALILCIFSQSRAQLKEIPCGAIYKPNTCENASLDTMLDIEDFELCAPARLDPLSRDFVWGTSGISKTFIDNKEAYRRIWIKRKVLRGIAAKYSLETSVFGSKIAFPIGISPTLGQSVYNKEGEKGMAKGAASVGVIYTLNGFAQTSIEDVAAAVPKGSLLWLQTYILPNREDTANLVKRAERAGFQAIVATIDEPYAYDIRCNAIETFGNKYLQSGPNVGLNTTNYADPTLTFEDLSWLVGITKLPIVAKGITTSEDALKAITAGAKAIFVSNQGGRHFDDSIPTIEALPEIVEAVKTWYGRPKVDVFVDGGIRSGHDVFKALARGAKMAFIGRPAIWGLTMGGEKGVKKVLTILKDEFKNALINAGYSDPSQISQSSLISM